MERYLQYDHLELSEDPSFIRWTKGSSAKDNNDWDQWIQDHPEKMPIVEQAQSIVNAMKFAVEEPNKASKEKIWQNITAEINTEKNTTVKKTNGRAKVLRMITYGAVAAILLFVLFQNIGSDFDTTVQVPYASVENVVLPDGSEVTVNADSKLQFDRETWDNNRLVALDGEAFFSVKKGSKFSVQTQSGSVEVLGTSFNVYDRKGLMKVHCETGRVAVKSTGKETILTPKQSVLVQQETHTFNAQVPESENRSTWRSGIFVYTSASLEEVINELERQLDFVISIDKSLLNEKYTGSFNKADKAKALTEVFFPLGLKFDVNGKNVNVPR